MTTSVKDAFIASVSFLAVLFLWADMSRAECFVREQVNLPKNYLSQMSIHISNEVNRKQKHLLLSDGTYKCIVTTKVYTNGIVKTLERMGWAKNKSQSCTEAYSAQTGFWLENVDNIDADYYLGLDLIQQASELVCDTSFTRKKYVKVGESVNLADISIDPRFVNDSGDIQFISPIDAPNQKCTIFTETAKTPDGIPVQNTGYVCMIGKNWTIWKKWESIRYDNDVDNYALNNQSIIGK